MHSILPFFLATIAAIVLLNMLAIKLKVAYPIVLVLAGLLVSFAPGLPVFKINPNLIFFIFLPPLLFFSAWSVSFKEMKKWWRIITSFAFLVVFFTAFSVAVVSNYFLPGFSIALGFLLGGIVSPPDAVSTAAITKFVKIPKSTSAILEGESLLNDASSLIIFRFALIAVGKGQLAWQEVATSFLWMVFGGTGIGLLLGWLFVQAHKYLPTDAPSDVVLTIIEPYLMYWLAEQVESSGVLAVVAGGLFMSTKRLTFLGSTSRIRGLSVWESFVFIINGFVFISIGLEMPYIVNGLRNDGISLRTAIGYGLLVTGVLFVTRLISSYTAMFATVAFRPTVARQITAGRRRWKGPLVLAWTGMRGVVSLAAALSIPEVLENGNPFPHRSLILFITFVAILLTLVIQGLTLPYLIKRTRVFEGIFKTDHEEEDTKKIKQGLKLHIVSFLKEKYEQDKEAHPSLKNYIKMWEERSEASEDSWMTDDTKKTFKELLESQRQYLSNLNKNPAINEELIRKQIYQIDLEEERLRII